MRKVFFALQGGNRVNQEPGRFTVFKQYSILNSKFEQRMSTDRLSGGRQVLQHLLAMILKSSRDFRLSRVHSEFSVEAYRRQEGWQEHSIV